MAQNRVWKLQRDCFIWSFELRLSGECGSWGSPSRIKSNKNKKLMISWNPGGFFLFFCRVPNSDAPSCDPVLTQRHDERWVRCSTFASALQSDLTKQPVDEAVRGDIKEQRGVRREPLPSCPHAASCRPSKTSGVDIIGSDKNQSGSAFSWGLITPMKMFTWPQLCLILKDQVDIITGSCCCQISALSPLHGTDGCWC